MRLFNTWWFQVPVQFKITSKRLAAEFKSLKLTQHTCMDTGYSILGESAHYLIFRFKCCSGAEALQSKLLYPFLMQEGGYWWVVGSICTVLAKWKWAKQCGKKGYSNTTDLPGCDRHLGLNFQVTLNKTKHGQSYCVALPFLHVLRTSDVHFVPCAVLSQNCRKTLQGYLQAEEQVWKLSQSRAWELSGTSPSPASSSERTTLQPLKKARKELSSSILGGTPCVNTDHLLTLLTETQQRNFWKKVHSILWFLLWKTA